MKFRNFDYFYIFIITTEAFFFTVLRCDIYQS